MSKPAAMKFVEEHGVDIALGLLGVAEQFPFVSPLANVLKSTLDLCGRVVANKKAAKQYADRLEDVAELVTAALKTCGSASEAEARIARHAEKLHSVITDSQEFLASFTKQVFLVRWMTNKKVEECFAEIDKSLTDTMQQLSLALNIAQFEISRKTYEIFDSEKFLNENGGLAAVAADAEKLAELASHLDCSMDDLRDEVVDGMKRLEEEQKNMRQDFRDGLKEVLDNIKNPAIDFHPIDVRLLAIDRKNVLGEGGFGLVYRGTYNGEDVAIKTLKNFASQRDEKIVRELRQEVKTLFALGKCPGFVRLFGANLEPARGELCMVLELADGSLDDLIHTNKLGVDLTFALKTSIALDIARAMDALHGMEMIFRDLKPLNVLVFFKGRERRIAAKLTDFGLAKGVSDKSSTNAGGNIKGTLPYMAPELFETTSSRVPYSFASDVYALGITLNELLLQERPFHDFQGNVAFLMRHIESGHTPVPFQCPPNGLPSHKAMESIVHSCLARDPFVRPRMSAVVEDMRNVCSAVLEIARTGLSFSTTRSIPLRSIIVARPPPSSLTQPQNSERNTDLSGKSQNKGLSELSVEEVAYLLHKLEMPDKCCAAVIEEKIAGDVLCHAETVEDLTDCGLHSGALSKIHAKSLLAKVLRFQTNGVPLEYLRSTEVPFTKSDSVEGKHANFKDVPVQLPPADSYKSGGREEGNNGLKPFDYASKEEIRTILMVEDQKSFLSHIRRWCVESKKKSLSPLYLAAGAGDVEGVRALLECTFDMVKNENEGVKQFMRESIEERVGKIEHRMDRNTPLHYAAMKGHTETVSLLISQRANIEAQNIRAHTPLLIAADNGHTETVSLLISQRANIEAKDKSECTPLYIAAWKGRTETVSLLISQRANMEAMDKFDRYTPLHIAAEKGRTETVFLLISQRANMEAKSGHELTPLHYAALNGQTETVSLLISQRANIEAESGDGSTPFHIAAVKGHTDIVSLLISQRANIEAKDKYGHTPLHAAARGGHTETVSLLISQRANIEAKSRRGETPLDITVNKNIKALLKKAKKEKQKESGGKSWNPLRRLGF